MRWGPQWKANRRLLSPRIHTPSMISHEDVGCLETRWYLQACKHRILSGTSPCSKILRLAILKRYRATLALHPLLRVGRWKTRPSLVQCMKCLLRRSNKLRLLWPRHQGLPRHRQQSRRQSLRPDGPPSRSLNRRPMKRMIPFHLPIRQALHVHRPPIPKAARPLSQPTTMFQWVSICMKRDP